MTQLNPDQLTLFETQLADQLRQRIPPPVQPKRVGMLEFTTRDLLRLNTCKQQVLLLALSGRWFTNKELIELTGAIDAPRRRRELETVDGYRFEKRNLNGTNIRQYRLIEDNHNA